MKLLRYIILWFASVFISAAAFAQQKVQLGTGDTTKVNYVPASVQVNKSLNVQVTNIQNSKTIYYYGTSITAGLGAGFANTTERARYRYSRLLSKYMKKGETNKAVNGQFLKRYGIVSSLSIPTFYDSIASATWIPTYDSNTMEAIVIELGLNEVLCTDTGYTAPHFSTDMSGAIDAIVAKGWPVQKIIWTTTTYQKGYYSYVYPSLAVPDLARQNAYDDTIRARGAAKGIKIFDAYNQMKNNGSGLLINSGEDVHGGYALHRLYAYGLYNVLTATVGKDTASPQALAANGVTQLFKLIYSNYDTVKNINKVDPLVIDSAGFVVRALNAFIVNAALGMLQKQAGSIYLNGFIRGARLMADSTGNGVIGDSVLVINSTDKTVKKICFKCYVDSLVANIPIIDTSSLSIRINNNVSSVSATYPLVSSGGTTPNISIATSAFPAPIMKNPTIVRLQYTTPGVSTYNMYTCPEGKRAALYTLNAFDYPNAGASVRYHIKNASGDFIVVTNANIAAAGTGLATGTVGYIMEFGDTLQVETLTAALNVNAFITEFDTGGSNVRSVRAMNLSTGPNTVYTCPNGKSAVLLASTLLPTVQSGALNFGNDGSTRTFYFNNVPSGGSPATTNQVTKAIAQNASQRSISAVGTALTPGDFISVNVDVGATNQWAWVNVLEW
jgi:hypothetical protein